MHITSIFCSFDKCVAAKNAEKTYTHTHTYTHSNADTRTYIYIHAHIHTQTYKYICIYIRVKICEFTNLMDHCTQCVITKDVQEYAHTHTQTHTHMRTHTHAPKYIFVYICTYANIQKSTV